jgi:hypothetical protein
MIGAPSGTEKKRRFKQKINPRKRDPSNIKRADKPKRRKRHLKEPARLNTPKEGSIKGRKKRERREKRKKTRRPPRNEVASHKQYNTGLIRTKQQISRPKYALPGR